MQTAVSFGSEQDTAVRMGRLSEIIQVAGRVVQLYARVQPGEQVVILTDTEVSPFIIESLVGAVQGADATPTLVRIQPLAVHNNEPTAPVTAALNAADLMILPLSKSIIHSRSVMDAIRGGTRALAMSNITEDAFIHGAALADPREMARYGEAYREQLRGSKEVHITHEDGTDLRFSVAGRDLVVDVGILPTKAEIKMPIRNFGDAGKTFPAGECYCCPIEESVEGTLVVNYWMQAIGLVDEPIRMQFRDGICRKITGGRSAESLNKLLEDQGDQYSRYIGEFALGLNRQARVGGNPHREGKKILGSIHMALGTGVACGGKFQSAIHLDGVILGTTICVDGKPMVEKGRPVVGN